MSEDTQHERRLMLIAAIGLLIIVLAARLLLLTETSLNQGRGPGLEGESSVSILFSIFEFPYILVTIRISDCSMTIL